MKIKANDGKTYDVPDRVIWHDGRPLEIGWWPCRLHTSRMLDHLRFWNGNSWSRSAFTWYSQHRAGLAGCENAEYIGQYQVQWADRWWLKGGSA